MYVSSEIILKKEESDDIGQARLCTQLKIVLEILFIDTLLEIYIGLHCLIQILKKSSNGSEPSFLFLVSSVSSCERKERSRTEEI